MRLTKIKLAGFKSFVDPTTFHMPGQRLGIVGPNGCGKSNIIDAVRWVMGESSVRQLRGESMEDVIFNGSANRKPVGQASIELVFDNGAGKLEGAWGRYNEIAVKRIISRGGQSVYQINGTRCRRRDITEIFLGTGLGPRSYAIIEQGTISRIIESKPEELRVFLEEAAGISKYKERRRETETRIRHTRENLDRLNDVRTELDKQLQHLQRQARNAEKYKQYRDEERQLKAQLFALRWRTLDTDIQAQESRIRDQETALAAVNAELTGVENQLVEGREQQTRLNEILSQKQEQHFQTGSEIARLEQTLDHQRQLHQRQQEDTERAEQDLQQTREQMENDQARLEVLTGTIDEYQQTLEESQAIAAEYAEQLAGADQAMRDWQQQWQTFNQDYAEQKRISDVEKTRIEQLQRQQQQNQQRVERLQAEQAGLDEAEWIEQLTEQRLQEEESLAALETLQAQLEQTELYISERREQQTELNHSLGELQEKLHADNARLTSLKTLQEAALGDHETVLQDWLQNAGLQQAPRLAEQLAVEPGWEQAVETVLSPYLQAHCVDDVTTPANAVNTLKHGELTLLEMNAENDAAALNPGSDLLISKVQAGGALGAFLHGVHTAEDLPEALQRHQQLQNGESLITRNGVWLGRHWLRVSRPADESDSGVLLRERQIRELEQTQQDGSQSLTRQRQHLDKTTSELSELEQQRKQQQASINQSHRDHAQLESRVATLENRLQQVQQRRQSISDELEDLQQQTENQQEEYIESQQRLQESLMTVEQFTQQRDQLSAQQEQLQSRLEQCRSQHEDIRRATQDKIVASESLKSEYQALQKTQQRLQAQHQELQTRYQQLQTTQPADDEPQLTQQLEDLLQQRLRTEQALNEARQAVESENLKLQQLERQRSQCQHKSQEQREALEKSRLHCNEAGVRRQTLVDQLKELNVTLSAVIAGLPEEAEEDEWQARLEAIAGRIQRLGAINLAAIEEFEQLSERKTYLDAQNDDLMEALNTLESAMARIDRETRTRFQEMYDQVNKGLQNLFPRLFGGGQAYLDLTGEDALEAGVTIMARPPGKRNGTIHLLSGGEKALTAVAFIFAIFQLNPAPFCMLDEVDAPLDDANVSRFGVLLKEMSDQVQFIVVTHNKVTMEVVDHLTGVTMHEPGVSRLVSVDVDEAVRLAAV